MRFYGSETISYKRSFQQCEVLLLSLILLKQLTCQFNIFILNY